MNDNDELSSTLVESKDSNTSTRRKKDKNITATADDNTYSLNHKTDGASNRSTLNEEIRHFKKRTRSEVLTISLNSDVTTQSFSSDIPQNSWEHWLLQKELQLRSRIQDSILQKQLEREKARQKELEDQRKKDLFVCVFHEWKEEKNKAFQRKQLKSRKKEIKEKIAKESENTKNRERAEQQYKQWLQAKRRHDAEFKKNRENMLKLEEEREKAKRKKNAAAFSAWLKKNPKKPAQKFDDCEVDIDMLMGRILL